MKDLQDALLAPAWYCLSVPDPANLPARMDALAERIQQQARVAILDKAGTMVSNLRVWENLVLPAWYHGGGALSDWESPVQTVLAQSGLNEAQSRQLMGSLPAALDQDARRLLVLIRARIFQPDWYLLEQGWLDWLLAQDASHPARSLWASGPKAMIVLGGHAPGAAYEEIKEASCS